MTCYSIQPRDQIFVKDYGFFLSFAKNMSKNESRNISKILNGKSRPKRLDHARQYATDALKVIEK